MVAVLIVLLVFFIILLGSLTFYYVASVFRYKMILKRDSIVQKIITSIIYKDLRRYNIDFFWWTKQKYSVIKTKSKDGLNLIGYYINQNSNKTALLVHGYGSNAFEMQAYVKMFLLLGYNILAVDNRGHGKSDGKIISMGYYEKQDIGCWVNFLIKNDKNIQIVVFGVSMGGASVCLYSGESKPQNVKAIISDCAYSSAYEIVKHISDRSVIFSIFPTLKVFDLYCKKKVGFCLSDIDVVYQVQKCDIPILFIHGDKDNFVPFYMLGELYGKCPQKYRHKFVASGASHGASLFVAKEKYIKKVQTFLEKYVKN